ncbi:molybdopterin-binding protein [Micromonospora sp. NPDC049044]|uniref:molybdopterin-binding protein n=1 Tax=unclassified Micromonospora TaxID=2617518 RepID=UPI0033C4B527
MSGPGPHRVCPSGPSRSSGWPGPVGPSPKQGPAAGPGQVRDALAPVVTALTIRAGGEVAHHRLLPDHADALHNAITRAHVDVVVITGSSSAGAADHLRGVLATLNARWHIDGVACRPGRPQALASTADGRWIVGLPGNPFAGLAPRRSVRRGRGWSIGVLITM